MIPLGRAAFRQELVLIAEWHNTLRPHAALGSATPDEVYFKRFPQLPQAAPRNAL